MIYNLVFVASVYITEYSPSLFEAYLVHILPFLKLSYGKSVFYAMYIPSFFILLVLVAFVLNLKQCLSCMLAGS